MEGRDVLLMGLPRSGTTLTCHLLNKVEDTVALHEPMEVRRFASLEGDAAVCAHIAEFFSSTRSSLREHGTALSKHDGGRVPDNPVRNEYADTGARVRQCSNPESIRFAKPISDNCTIVLKHNAAFAALAGSLADCYPCYAVVRNPLSVLASWATVPMPVRNGHAPAAERLAPSLKEALEAITDTLDRQILLLDWFFGQFAKYIRQESILRYEETIASGGRNLSVIVGAAGRLNEALYSRNRNSVYDKDLMVRNGKRLLARDGAFWDFYSRESVERLVHGVA